MSLSLKLPLSFCWLLLVGFNLLKQTIQHKFQHHPLQFFLLLLVWNFNSLSNFWFKWDISAPVVFAPPPMPVMTPIIAHAPPPPRMCMRTYQSDIRILSDNQ